MTHICISKLIIIGSDNGLSPGRRQAIIWTNAGILFIWPIGTTISEILIKIHVFFIQENAFENIVCEMSAILSRPQCVKIIQSLWTFIDTSIALWLSCMSNFNQALAWKLANSRLYITFWEDISQLYWFKALWRRLTNLGDNAVLEICPKLIFNRNCVCP